MLSEEETGVYYYVITEKVQSQYHHINSEFIHGLY